MRLPQATWMELIFVVEFGLNMVRWLKPAEASTGR
jgi:hypothetical protein